MNSHSLFISNITVNESQDGKVHAILGRHNRKIEVSFRVGQNYMNIEEKTFKKSKMTPVRIDINDNLNTHELVQLINGLISIHNGRLNPVIIGSGEPSPSFSVNEYHTTDMNEKYQAVIDGIYQTPVKEDITHENRVMGAYYLACAIKECMTHKDSAFIGNGYLWEKVSKAMKELGMPIKEDSA